MDEKFKDTWFFEDVPVGTKTRSKTGRTIRECDILNFAGISGEYAPIHIDDEYAKKTKYGGIVAQDILLYTFTPSIEPTSEMMSKMNNSILATKGQKNWKFLGKAKVGDTIYTSSEIVRKEEKTPKNGGVSTRGTIIIQMSILNQRDEILQTGEYHLVLAKRCYFEPKKKKAAK